MHRTLAGLAVVALLALPGCTQSGQSAASPSPTGETMEAKEKRRESLRADCMKGKGFTYVPWIMPREETTAEEKKLVSGDYEAMKADRTKRGFYMFFGMVYRKDKFGLDNWTEDPNNKVIKKLSKTQAAAWDKANRECFAKVAKTVYNRVVKDEQDFWAQQSELTDKVLARELNGNPQLIELGVKFGDCLKGMGYKVPSVRPTDLNVRGRQAIQEEATALAVEQSGKKHKLEKGQFMMPEFTPAQARPHLQREIKAALDDLECGREFYAVFKPMQEKVYERASEEFGLGR